MKYKIKVYSIWEYGQSKDSFGNPHQEDNLYPPHEQANEKDRVFILCDGMGGHDAGEVASATVCEALSNAILQRKTNGSDSFTEEDLTAALDATFAALDAKDTGAEKKMGTTMTLLKLYEGGCCIAHMGDSRVYQIRPGKDEKDTTIVFRTKDHSLVNDLVQMGEMTEEEAQHSRRKNVITRALQPHMEYRPRADVKWQSDIQPGDYFYLCTDGMLEKMSDEQLCYHFSRAGGNNETKVKNLIKATQENRDNHSAIIVHVLEVAGKAAVPIEEAPKTKRQKAASPKKRANMLWLWILLLIAAGVAIAYFLYYR